jgi:lipid-A-disaccharide synthase
VLPGSRRGEVERLAPVFGKTLERIIADRPDIRVVVPAADAVAARVRELVSTWPCDVLVVGSDGNEKRAAFGAADVAMAASGTVSLELAAANTPMVIAYDMNWISRVLIARLLKTDTVTLVNLVSETRVVPEFLGKNCDPAKNAAGVLDVRATPGAQNDAMTLPMARRGRGGEAPGLRAARAVMSVVG